MADPSLDPTVAAALDAGPQLTVTGGAGGASGTLTADQPHSPYMGLLGGILNISGATMPPPFLDGGPFTITGPGGKDVGPFTTTIALAPAITWTNPPSTINRASPLTLTWTGGDSTADGHDSRRAVRIRPARHRAGSCASLRPGPTASPCR